MYTTFSLDIKIISLAYIPIPAFFSSRSYHSMNIPLIIILYLWAKRNYPKWSSWVTPRTSYLIQSRKNFPTECVQPTPHSYVDQKFLQSYKATVGADFMEK